MHVLTLTDWLPPYANNILFTILLVHISKTTRIVYFFLISILCKNITHLLCEWNNFYMYIYKNNHIFFFGLPIHLHHVSLNHIITWVLCTHTYMMCYATHRNELIIFELFLLLAVICLSFFFLPSVFCKKMR